MSHPSDSPAPSRSTSYSSWLFLAILLCLACGTVWYLFTRGGRNQPAVQARESIEPRELATRQEPEDNRRRVAAPELEGGVAWLNTAGPLRLKDLRGKIVLLDFWTLCCINCMHVLPDLARLEKKYPNELVVIGIHTAKFQNEKNTESIRKAILRYEISHPVVNDAEQRIWETFGSRSWPTLCLIDPEGYAVWADSGEGHYEVLDKEISRLIKIHKEKKTLNDKPLRFQLARLQEKGDSPLFFPGKVLADAPGKRLFIADSTHHRIVITDLDGKKIAIAGAGEPGKVDGPFASARFNDPQGMALRGDLLYVADRKNHLLRVLDLKAQTVKTAAGTGEQGRIRRFGGPALETGLNSPWDLLLLKDRLFIAMAGHHQIWVLNLANDTLSPYAGSGREDVIDGTAITSSFAQPSGLASDGKTLWVADSEVSAVRAVSLDEEGEVKTLVGKGLFKFGDVDGEADAVRLQHALGIAYHDGKLYVADTYNSKIKLLDPVKRTCVTFLGGQPAGGPAGPLFSEPGGISYADGKLYVADTNAHRIRIVDVKTKTISTLKLQGVEPPQVKN
jgi:thiol-disulfide isomerase/thioredoxin